ncbi:MAG TPA: V-type ATP synthase subunit F [Lamprocystis sp. (in: g-proteobacteria)]|nr:V-type ATP synthase subunit F [Lamprocystis sp. (in: g-proteobacteria)]
MTGEHESGSPTRMVFLGEESLADGFRLIGFETHPDPEPDEVDRVLRDLSRNREKAFVVVDDRVMRADCPNLRRLRREGGRIVVIAVPPLNAPPVLSSTVADRLTALFGAAAVPAAPTGPSAPQQ